MYSNSSSFFNDTGGYGTATFKAVAHGVSRAAIAQAQGNNARSAFISGFVSSGFAAPRSWGFFGGTMATAAVSGTVSQHTSGKFANGAITGAFIHMFNSLSMKQSFQKLWNRKAEIGRDIIQGVKGGTQGIDKLMNMV